jgi:hypothetical protein
MRRTFYLPSRENLIPIFTRKSRLSLYLCFGWFGVPVVRDVQRRALAQVISAGTRVMNRGICFLDGRPIFPR